MHLLSPSQCVLSLPGVTLRRGVCLQAFSSQMQLRGVWGFFSINVSFCIPISQHAPHTAWTLVVSSPTFLWEFCDECWERGQRSIRKSLSWSAGHLHICLRDSTEQKTITHTNTHTHLVLMFHSDLFLFCSAFLLSSCVHKRQCFSWLTEVWARLIQLTHFTIYCHIKSSSYIWH